MADAWKSAAVVAVISFVYLVVLKADYVRKTVCLSDPCVVSTYRRSISFCSSWVADLPVLELLPCFVLNVGMLVLTFATIIGAVVGVRFLAGLRGDD